VDEPDASAAGAGVAQGAVRLGREVADAARVLLFVFHLFAGPGRARGHRRRVGHRRPRLDLEGKEEDRPQWALPVAVRGLGRGVFSPKTISVICEPRHNQWMIICSLECAKPFALCDMFELNFVVQVVYRAVCNCRKN
jgi:hypothetical protein